MKRVFLKVAYDGTDFHGWQLQPEVRTVEGELNRAIKELTGETVNVIGASRTDAGVHALGNVAVFDTDSAIPPERFSYALNTHLPDDVKVVESFEVPPGFHPRKTEVEKTYEYKIDLSAIPNPLRRRDSWNCPYALDVEKMREAAVYLTGEHDFVSFCSVHTQAESTVRCIYSVDVLKTTDTELKIVVKGNGFLYNMIRIIVGTLAEVGRGSREPAWVKEALEGKDRTLAGPTAPPEGLCLKEIVFKESAVQNIKEKSGE